MYFLGLMVSAQTCELLIQGWQGLESSVPERGQCTGQMSNYYRGHIALLRLS